MPFVYEVVGRDGEKYTIEDNGERLTQLVVSCENLEMLWNPKCFHAPTYNDKI